MGLGESINKRGQGDLLFLVLVGEASNGRERAAGSFDAQLGGVF